ncbi:Ppx/GppA family phosphatase [Pelomonas sp. CA6]|uniref:Ppx/GppA family phosphatase n=1 Tax=Pelomonas sp. CA6 TaxID=2907999 RepID=UPI001F4B9C4A|nr:Ppx/GppA family phosphatase [Pelomonas sp. CA6]MCH7342064.1 Ppx/GppA family phosphatase [Pelomonas sp. CA6]
MPSSSPAPQALAAIDMGSNSFRLEIAHMHRGSYRRVEYLKETVRLGAGLDEQSMLTEAAMQRGLDCLQRFATRLQGMPGSRVRAVATQTLREARNRNAFLARAQTVLGHPIEVISGREEARLIYAGVARLQPAEEPRLVIDIGGRSTEMILGQGRQPLKAESFQIGSVSLSLRFFPEGLFTPEAFRAAQVAAGAELEEALTLFARHLSRPVWQEALGSSGTVGAVSQLLAASGITDGRITLDGLRWCIEQCLAAGRMEALQLPGLKEERRAVVAGGLCILYTLLTHFEIEALLPAKGALRQGVIFDLVERLEAQQVRDGHDMRDFSAAELQQRFGVDREQAARVQEVALQLHRQLVPRASPELRRELGWAAALHEIGMMVSHHDHHRHSAYLLAHVDAPGFSQSQLRRLGDLALGQRGGLRKLEEQLQDESLLWQLLALRLAVIKCHARSAVDARAMRLERRGRQIRVRMPRGWTQNHPRAHYLLREEMAAWSKLELLTLDLQD